MTIYPDWTILFQFAFFLASFWALKTFFFPPVLDVIKRRITMIEKANEQLRHYDAEGRQMQKAYEGRLRDARIQAQDIRNQARKETAQKERERLDQAREEASKILAKGESEIEDQRAQAHSQIESKARDLSAQIVEKVLGRSVPS